MWFNGKTFRVKLDGGGSTLVESADKIDLANATLEVDILPGFAGTVGEVFNIAKAATFIETTGLTLVNLSSTATFSWSVIAVSGFEVLQLTVLEAKSSFELWTEDYGLTGTDAAATNDYDADGLSNLYEFGLGGDPTNSADRGISPTYGLVEDAGTWMNYIYPKQSDVNSGLNYYLELTDDLIYESWTNSGYSVVGTGTINSDFDAVTNRISADTKDEQFIRLIIEEQ